MGVTTAPKLTAEERAKLADLHCYCNDGYRCALHRVADQIRAAESAARAEAFDTVLRMIDRRIGGSTDPGIIQTLSFLADAIRARGREGK